METVVVVEALCQSPYSHGQQIHFAGMTRPTRRTGLVEQAAEWRRVDSSGDAPGVVEQGRDVSQRDLLSGKLTMGFAGQEDALELAVLCKLIRPLLVRPLLTRKLYPTRFGVALQQRGLGRLGQVAPEQPG